MTAEYDFSQGERGRFAKALAQGYDIVVDGRGASPRHVSVEEVRASQALLRAGRRARRVTERG